MKNNLFTGLWFLVFWMSCLVFSPLYGALNLPSTLKPQETQKSFYDLTKLNTKVFYGSFADSEIFNSNSSLTGLNSQTLFTSLDNQDGACMVDYPASSNWDGFGDLSTYQFAADFVTPTGSEILLENISLKLIYEATSLNIAILSDDNGVPGETVLPFVNVYPQYQLPGPADTYDVVLDMSSYSFMMDGGTKYWLAVTTIPATYNGNYWYISDQIYNGTNFYHDIGYGNGWEDINNFGYIGDAAFSINCEIEEPEGCGELTDGGVVTVSPNTGPDPTFVDAIATGYPPAELGISYSWQFNLNGSPWMTLATSSEYFDIIGFPITGELGDVYGIRLETTCMLSGDTVYSEIDTFEIVADDPSSCIPFFTNGWAPITSVVFADIDNQSSANNPDTYEDFTYIVGNVQAGNEYEITLKGNTGGGLLSFFTVFLNWDDNWMTSQMIEVGSIDSSTGEDSKEVSTMIYIPDDIPEGSYTMRIVKGYDPPTEACGTDYMGQAEDYILYVAEADACFNVNAGDIMDDFSICSDTEFTLMTENTPSGFSGLHFQWFEASSPEGPWMIMDGANTPAYTVENGIQNETWYYLEVTCDKDGSISQSDTVFVEIKPILECYCTPNYMISNLYLSEISSNGGDPEISYSVSSLPQGNYDDQTHQVLGVYQGQDLTIDTYFPSSENGIKIWIDFNDDGYFSEDEAIAYLGNSFTAKKLELNIPLDALGGDHRMRVMGFNSAYTDPESCDNLMGGSTVDFTVHITEIPACTEAEAGEIMDDFMICPGLGFTLESQGASPLQPGIGYQWMTGPSPEGPWTELEGADADTYYVAGGIQADTWYYLAVTCGENGDEKNSLPVHVSLNMSSTECYCVPEGINPARYIDYFTAEGDGDSIIENHESGFSPGGYGDFSSMIVSVEEAGTISFEAFLNSPESGRFRVWVDWDKNGSFDSNELVYAGDSYQNGHFGDFGIPMGTSGLYRMRIANNWNVPSGDTDPCATGFEYGEFEDYSIDVTSLANCTDVNAGIPIETSGYICPDTAILLEVEGASELSGDIVRTWQSSPAGENIWTDIAGSETPTYTYPGITEPTDFRYVVSCGGDTDMSEVISYTVNSNVLECYCIPSGVPDHNYGIQTFGAWGGNDNIILNEMTWYSANGYGDFTHLMADTWADGTVEVAVVPISGIFAGFRIWVDWNLDGVFSEDEIVWHTTDYVMGVGYGEFDVPQVPVGQYRMRVASHRLSPEGDVDPCEINFDQGEFEDYTLNVIQLEECANPNGGIPVEDEIIMCLGEGFTVEVTGASEPAIGLSRIWQFSWDGETDWQDIDGAVYPTASLTINSGGTEGYLRYHVVCDLDGEIESNSDLIYVYVNPDLSQCYCTPGGNSSIVYINNFTAEGNGDESIENLNSGYSVGGYGDFTDMRVTANSGENVNFSVSGPDTFGFRIWVDWNRNGLFEGGEVVWSSSGYDSPHSGSFVMPENSFGEYRMRIVNSLDYGNANVHPCATSIYGEYEDYTLVSSTAEFCVEPNAGAPVESNKTVCMNTPFEVSVAGASIPAVGQIRKWQSALAGSEDWTDIPGQFLETLNVSGISFPMDYRFIIGCDEDYDISEVIHVSLNPNPEECYCTPESSGTNGFINNFMAVGNPIGDQMIENINSGPGMSGYSNFRSMIVDAAPGELIEFTAGMGSLPAGLRIWVDWDGNGEFFGDDVWNSTDYAMIHEGSFVVPSDALGTYILRIASASSSKTGPGSPCGLSGSGEYEDYTINVVAPLPPCDATMTLTAVDLNGAPIDCVDEFGFFFVEVNIDGGGSGNNFSYSVYQDGQMVGTVFEGDPEYLGGFFFYGDTAAFEFVGNQNFNCSGSASVTPEMCPEPVCDISLTTIVDFDGDCIDQEDSYKVLATINGESNTNTSFSIGDNTSVYVSDAVIGETYEIWVPAGTDGEIWATGNTDMTCVTEVSSFESPAVCDDDGGEFCDWRIRVWGNDNGEGVTWYLKDGNNVIVDSGTGVGVPFNHVSPVYNLVEPVTFNLNVIDPNNPEGYRSVTYNVFRNGQKIHAGTVRNKEITFVDYCSDDTEMKGVSATLTDFDFSYYPNPVKDVLYINSGKEVKEVLVYNMAGQQVLNFNKVLSTNNELDVTKLPNGIYVFRAVLDGGQIETFKVVKK